MPVPESPPGYGDPTQLPQSRWLLELVALAVFAGLVFTTGLHTRFRVTPRESQWIGILVIIVTGFLHETGHYAVSKGLGFDPVIEAVPPRIYSRGQWTARGDDLILLLTPLVFIDVAGAVVWFGPFGATAALSGQMAVVVNTAVSVPDLYRSLLLSLKPPGTITIVVRDDEGLTEFVAEPLP